MSIERDVGVCATVEAFPTVTHLEHATALRVQLRQILRDRCDRSEGSGGVEVHLVPAMRSVYDARAVGVGILITRLDARASIGVGREDAM